MTWQEILAALSSEPMSQSRRARFYKRFLDDIKEQGVAPQDADFALRVFRLMEDDEPGMMSALAERYGQKQVTNEWSLTDGLTK